MKSIIAICISSIVVMVSSCDTEVKQQIAVSSPVQADTINYAITVQPVFQKNCSPCHFPGGKMYDKLPFDKGETIIHHSNAIVKRIKDEKDVAIVKQFIQQHEAVE